MFNEINEAKEKMSGVVFRQFQNPTITWEDILNFLYRESTAISKTSKDLEEKVQKIGNPTDFNSIGNVQIQSKFWLAPQTSKLFEEFSDVSELLYKLNNSEEDRGCGHYRRSAHDCGLDWHYQGIRVSLSNRVVSDHHDPHDIFYWQIVGTSFWKIDGDITYTLNPGDLFYLPKENSHEVWCDGPRAGLLIDNLN